MSISLVIADGPTKLREKKIRPYRYPKIRLHLETR